MKVQSAPQLALASRALALTLLVSVAACAAPPDEHPRVDEGASAPAAAPSIPPEALAVLDDAAVTHDAFARRILYTWTTPEGAAKLRAARRLLLPTSAEGHFVAEIDALAADGTSAAREVARLLSTHPSFAARRYAWTRPFATREPLAGRSYGDRLVAVTLKTHAVIARFDASDAVPFRFVDLDGHDVPLGHVLADPSVLAAVYHVGKHPDSGAPYREYVLCNESMIAEWSLDTDAISGLVQADARAMRALASADTLTDEPASPRWGQPSVPEEGDVGARYASSLAFDTERHRPTRENLERIAGLLEAVEAGGAPLVVVPTVPFTRVIAGPPPVPPLPPGFGVKKRRIYVCD